MLVGEKDVQGVAEGLTLGLSPRLGRKPTSPEVEIPRERPGKAKPVSIHHLSILQVSCQHSTGASQAAVCLRQEQSTHIPAERSAVSPSPLLPLLLLS